MRDALPMESLKAVYGRLAHRYDVQHGLITFGSDARGRRLVVERTVAPGNAVLDCGTGTGGTGLLAAHKAGPSGQITFFDLSTDMLAVAKRKVAAAGLNDRCRFASGDLLRLPFDDESFDAVLSTYSLCPVYNPGEGGLELYRVLKPGGRLGVVHSAEAPNRFIRSLSNVVEDVAWRFPWLSMGCRPVQVLPALEAAGAEVVYQDYFGVPLWPFFAFVVTKPRH